MLWAPACTYMAMLFFASSVPGDELPGHVWDKLGHLLAYAVLGILFLPPLCGGRLLEMRGATAAIAVRRGAMPPQLSFSPMSEVPA